MYEKVNSSGNKKYFSLQGFKSFSPVGKSFEEVMSRMTTSAFNANEESKIENGYTERVCLESVHTFGNVV